MSRLSRSTRPPLLSRRLSKSGSSNDLSLLATAWESAGVQRSNRISRTKEDRMALGESVTAQCPHCMTNNTAKLRLNDGGQQEQCSKCHKGFVIEVRMGKVFGTRRS